ATEKPNVQRSTFNAQRSTLKVWSAFKYLVVELLFFTCLGFSRERTDRLATDPDCALFCFRDAATTGVATHGLGARTRAHDCPCVGLGGAGMHSNAWRVFA